LALLWCTFKASNRNTKASPTETKAQRRRQDCRTPLSLWYFMVFCYSYSCSDIYILSDGCYVSYLILPLSFFS
jgi:hypothetical protein